MVESSASRDSALLAQFQAGREVVENEGIYIDERRWDEWLALYVEDCEFWAPMWKDDTTLTEDPQTQGSHIYYDTRVALEDRVVRFTSPLSPASNPPPRTAHILTGFRLLSGGMSGEMLLRSTWTTHVYYPNRRLTHTFFGRVEHELVLRGSDWLIARKKVVLLNDHIPTMLDFYCL